MLVVYRIPYKRNGAYKLDTAVSNAIYFLFAAIFVSESVKNYKSGILDPKDCNKKPTNHAVLLMGFGSGSILSILKDFSKMISFFKLDFFDRGRYTILDSEELLGI